MANETSRKRRAPWVAAMVLSASASAAAQHDAALGPALDFFTRYDAAGVSERFDSVRPAPVSPEERQQIMAMLPAEGAVRELDRAQREKLAAVQRVLELHGRDGVYVLKVIEVPQAAVALHARAVVLVSESALELLEPEEVQAVVAHEVGHEYFWDQYAHARRGNSPWSLRRLELLCDGIAAVTLHRLGVDPERLTTALEKMYRYNRNRFGTALNENHYPAISERRTLVRRLAEWLGQSGAQ